MRINTFTASAVIIPLLASSAAAADIQIWSNEKELENGNHLILDADDTGGDIFLQFGNTLSETFSWDNTNLRFNLSDNLHVEGNISLTGNVEMQALATVDGVDVSELGADVTALENRVTTNEGNIATNATNIAGNTSNIATNANNIASNDTDIAALQAEQTTQDANITTNANNIASNDTDIAALQTEQTTQDANITTNANNIASNDTDIAALQTEQTIQDANITTNANNIASNDTDIAALQTNVGDLDFTGANYLVFGSDLTAGLLALDTQIKANATDIDALETLLATPKTETHLVPLGGATIKEDGTDNIVNVFRSADDTGFGHNFHTVTTSQTTLQDINLDFGIITPADIDSLSTITLSYKTDGTATDSKIDITVVDSTGTTIATSTGLSANAWSDITLDISGHTPTAGELLTIEVTGYTQSENAAYIGEIVFDYTESK